MNKDPESSKNTPWAPSTKAAAQEISVTPNDRLIIYSDGCKGLSGAVEWSYVICRAGEKVAQGKGRLGLAEVFDGEVEGARHGLRHACRMDQSAQIPICIDNTSVVQGLLGPAPASSQEAFLDFQQISETVQVPVRWVPGHQDIRGNEEADRLAKAGAKLPDDKQAQPTVAGVSSLRKVYDQDPILRPVERNSPYLQRLPRPRPHCLPSLPEGTRPLPPDSTQPARQGKGTAISNGTAAGATAKRTNAARAEAAEPQSISSTVQRPGGCRGSGRSSSPNPRPQGTIGYACAVFLKTTNFFKTICPPSVMT
ncbi:Fc.00g082380.m01.CDS01 [Cosmosporella sp. VM-42]